MIFQILESIYISFIAAFGTMFFSFIIGDPQNGNTNRTRILSWYGLWIERKYNEKEELVSTQLCDAVKEAENEIVQMKKAIGDIPVLEIVKIQNRQKRKVRKMNWWKAAGMCHLCFNVYFTAAVFGVWLLLSQIHILFILPCIFISNQILRRLS